MSAEEVSHLIWIKPGIAIDGRPDLFAQAIVRHAEYAAFGNGRVVVQGGFHLGALDVLAAEQDPAGGAWSAGGQSPVSGLPSWQITTPSTDAGSLSAAWQPGVPSLLATYQGLWGLTLTAFPFPVLPTNTPMPEPDAPAVMPAFTG